MRYLLILLLVICILLGSLYTFSCQPGGPETVLLQGAVTIGPISPVEQQGGNPPVPAGGV